MPRTPIAPPCPACGQCGVFAGLDAGGFDLFACAGNGGCTVNEYRRGMVISRTQPIPPGEPPASPPR